MNKNKYITIQTTHVHMSMYARMKRPTKWLFTSDSIFKLRRLHYFNNKTLRYK